MLKALLVLAVVVGAVVALFGVFFLIGVLFSDNVRAGDLTLGVGALLVGAGLVGVPLRRLVRS